jgi:hypothetical protein
MCPQRVRLLRRVGVASTRARRRLTAKNGAQAYTEGLYFAKLAFHERGHNRTGLPGCPFLVVPEMGAVQDRIYRRNPNCRQLGRRRGTDLSGSLRFSCKMTLFPKWAMLGSNQRPLPCEVRSILSWLFAAVQKLLQISIFSLEDHRECSPLFVWVGVLLVYTSLTATPAH